MTEDKNTMNCGRADHVSEKKRSAGILLPILVALNIMFAAILIFTAYAGHINPDEMPFAGLAGMTFAGWCVVNVVMLAVDLICSRRTRILALFPLGSLISCAGPMWTFCPLNIGQHEVAPQDSARMFKVMSYNVLSFHDNEPDKTIEGFNRTAHIILHSGADVVIMAEFDNQGALNTFVPQSQIDSLNAVYPYFVLGKHGNACYSKTPILYAVLPSQQYASGSHEVYRTIINGRGVMIFGVHLVSFGLDADDKSLYHDITEMETKSVHVSDVRSRLIEKLYGAFKQRNVQAQYIREYVEQMPGENVIVCGDFNDVPGCRAIKVLEEAGLKDAYSEVGCGPMITFNDSRLFFRIDHVLYSGAFRPVSVERGDIRSSDHYPLLTTFIWDE